MIRTLNVLIAVLAVVAASGPAAANSETLTEEEFRAEIVGRTITAQRGFITMKAIHRADGTSSLRSSFRNSEGTWRFERGQVCVRWEKLRNGQERCGALTRIGNGRYRGQRGIEFQVQ